MNDAPGAPARDLGPDTRITHILYALHLLAPFTAWILAIGAIIIGMVKSDDVRGTFLESHLSWLSRTFWWGLLWIAVCALIALVLVVTIVGVILAWIPFAVLFLWYLYRVIRGWLRLNDGKAIE